MNSIETEISLMESIHEAELGAVPLTQRALAKATGLSLGMTNVLVRRLAERGWVKLTKLSPRTIQYAMTPEGLAEVARRTSGYFRRAGRTVELYRERLEAFILEQKRIGIETIVLAGPSNVDFLLEYLCERHGLVFVWSADFEKAIALGRHSAVVLLFSERFDKKLDGCNEDVARLSRILGGL
jgi:DNA-binding MarR family transcriptional regulator